jgi:hypothetical protein
VNRPARVVGSGSSDNVLLDKAAKYIFCNSSVSRVPFNIKTIYGLVISEGILQSDKELQNHPNAIGLNKKQSLKMRQLKRQSLCGLHINNLVVNIDRSNVEVISKLKFLGITYDSLILLSPKDRSKLIVNYFGIKALLVMYKIGVIDLCKFLTSLIPNIDYKPPSSVRASTGMIAYLWSLQHFKGDHKVLLDGIGVSKKVFYPGESRLDSFEFNMAHKIDGYIYCKYKNTL